jgi:hypothetical protein
VQAGWILAAHIPSKIVRACLVCLNHGTAETSLTFAIPSRSRVASTAAEVQLRHLAQMPIVRKERISL